MFVCFLIIHSKFFFNMNSHLRHIHKIHTNLSRRVFYSLTWLKIPLTFVVVVVVYSCSRPDPSIRSDSDRSADVCGHAQGNASAWPTDYTSSGAGASPACATWSAVPPQLPVVNTVYKYDNVSLVIVLNECPTCKDASYILLTEYIFRSHMGDEVGWWLLIDLSGESDF